MVVGSVIPAVAFNMYPFASKWKSGRSGKSGKVK
jgi:hypothetical protein